MALDLNALGGLKFGGNCVLPSAIMNAVTSQDLLGYYIVEYGTAVILLPSTALLCGSRNGKVTCLHLPGFSYHQESNT
jgi:hypothetical protein